MAMPNDPKNFLMGGGIRSAKFLRVGDGITGKVLDSRVSQQTDIVSGEPQSWGNGDPKLQLVVTLQTTDREDGDDDGMRNIYVKGSQKTGSASMHAAVADAVRAAGAKDLEVGGTLSVQYIGDQPAATAGLNDRKTYRAAFQRPNGQQHSGTFLGTSPQQPVQQQPSIGGWGQQPQQAPPAYAQQSGPAETGWSQPTHVEGAPAASQQPSQPSQQGPSTDDLARFEAWKASQGQR